MTRPNQNSTGEGVVMNRTRDGTLAPNHYLCIVSAGGSYQVKILFGFSLKFQFVAPPLNANTSGTRFYSRVGQRKLSFQCSFTCTREAVRGNGRSCVRVRVCKGMHDKSSLYSRRNSVCCDAFSPRWGEMFFFIWVPGRYFALFKLNFEPLLRGVWGWGDIPSLKRLWNFDPPPFFFFYLYTVVPSFLGGYGGASMIW